MVSFFKKFIFLSFILSISCLSLFSMSSGIIKIQQLMKEEIQELRSEFPQEEMQELMQLQGIIHKLTKEEIGELAQELLLVLLQERFEELMLEITQEEIQELIQERKEELIQEQMYGKIQILKPSGRRRRTTRRI